MKFTKTILYCFLTSALMAQQSVGIFQNHADIGNPKLKGSAQYDQTSQTYTINGAGYNIWFDRDELHYLYNEIAGNFIVTANFELVGEGAAAHRKVGWMIRESLDEKASHCGAHLHGDGLTALQRRALRGAYIRGGEDEIRTPKTNYEILQLERKGKKVIFRAAHEGEPLQQIGWQIMNSFADSVLVGLFISLMM